MGYEWQLPLLICIYLLGHNLKREGSPSFPPFPVCLNVDVIAGVGAATLDHEMAEQVRSRLTSLHRQALTPPLT